MTQSSQEPQGSQNSQSAARKALAPTGFAGPDRTTATELWVVRHAESSWNASGRYQGQTDVSLSELGRRQAEALAERLRGQPFTAVYSSDLERARATAEIVAGALEKTPEVHLEQGLREIQVGELAGLTAEEIAERYPNYVAALRQDPWTTVRPGGESMRDLFTRSCETFRGICRRHKGGRVLVVTHGGLVRVAVGLALGEETGRHAWSRLSVANASITRVMLDGRCGTLLGFNDDAHLEDMLATWESRGPGGPVT